MFVKYATFLALLAAPHAFAQEEEHPDPVCLSPQGRLQLHNKSYSRATPDGRVIAFCYNNGDMAIDDNWITDIGAIIDTMIDNPKARCVDCKPNAEPFGCTGNSQIWNIDGNNDVLEAFGAKEPPPLDTYTRDVFLDVLRDMKGAGIKVKWGLTDGPILTIDTVKNGKAWRQSELKINGEGDTC